MNIFPSLTSSLIIFLSGASGFGKTTLLNALKDKFDQSIAEFYILMLLVFLLKNK